CVVPWNVEAPELVDEVVSVPLEPVAESDEGSRVSRRCTTRPSSLDRAVPGTDLLADVAAVDAAPELAAMCLGNRIRRLRGIREALRCVEHTGFVERSRRARVDARGA